MNNTVTNAWLGYTTPYRLAVARILFGSYMLVLALLYAPSIATLFSNNGFVVSFTSRWGQSVLDAPSAPVAIALYILTCSATISFIIGWHFRIASAVLVIATLYYYNLHFHLLDGTPFRLLWFTLLLFSVSGAHKAYSVAAVKPATPINALPETLIKIQISLLYIVSGGLKVLLPAWQNGDIVHYVLQGDLATNLGTALANTLLITQYSDSIVWLVIAGELFVGIGLWLKPTRLTAAILGTTFHLLVAFTISLWWFLFIPGLYVLFFKQTTSKTPITTGAMHLQQS